MDIVKLTHLFFVNSIQDITSKERAAKKEKYSTVSHGKAFAFHLVTII